jgi:two-component sensor histidine kinase
MKNPDKTEALDCTGEPEEEELLRLETHHRLMNTFAILCAILQQELYKPDPCSRMALERSVRMIRSHSALHRCLALGTPRRQVALGEYVAELSRCLSEAVLEPMDVACEALTDEGFMPAVQAERLGLVLCELVINAAKHGFPHKRAPGSFASKLLDRIMDGAAPLPITEAASRMMFAPPASAHRS